MKFELPYRGTIIEVEGVAPYKTDTDVEHFGAIKPENLKEEHRDLSSLFGKLSGKALVNGMVGQSYTVESVKEGGRRFDNYDFYKGTINDVLCYIESEDEIKRLTALVNADYDQAYLDSWVSKNTKEIYDLDIPSDHSLVAASDIGNLPLNNMLLKLIIATYIGLETKGLSFKEDSEVKEIFQAQFKLKEN